MEQRERLDLQIQIFQSEKQHRIKAGIFFNIKEWIKPQTHALKEEKVKEERLKAHCEGLRRTDTHINFSFYMFRFVVVVQMLSNVQLFESPWTAGH